MSINVDGDGSEREAEPVLPLGHEFGWTPAEGYDDKCSVWLPTNKYCNQPRIAHEPAAVTGPDVEGECLTLRELQERLPWTLPYSSEFEQSQMDEGHRNLMHDILHVQKSLGVLASAAEKIDHGRATGLTPEELADKVADLVICALHMARTNPLGVFDLEAVVVEKLETRNGVKLRGGHRG